MNTSCLVVLWCVCVWFLTLSSPAGPIILKIIVFWDSHCGTDDTVAHHTCKKKHGNFGDYGIRSDDSVRNHTQKSQSTTKHDVFMSTEALPTNECRQFFFSFYSWRHSFVGSVSVNMNTSCLVVLWGVCVWFLTLSSPAGPIIPKITVFLDSHV